MSVSNFSLSFVLFMRKENAMWEYFQVFVYLLGQENGCHKDDDVTDSPDEELSAHSQQLLTLESIRQDLQDSLPPSCIVESESIILPKVCRPLFLNHRLNIIFTRGFLSRFPYILVSSSSGIAMIGCPRIFRYFGFPKIISIDDIVDIGECPTIWLSRFLCSDIKAATWIALVHYNISLRPAVHAVWQWVLHISSFFFKAVPVDHYTQFITIYDPVEYIIYGIFRSASERRHVSNVSEAVKQLLLSFFISELLYSTCKCNECRSMLYVLCHWFTEVQHYSVSRFTCLHILELWRLVKMCVIALQVSMHYIAALRYCIASSHSCIALQIRIALRLYVDCM